MLFLIISVSFIPLAKTLRLDITGGKFAKNTYMNSYVIFGIGKVGPKMCVSDCMLYNGCTAVNFNKNELSCEFLSVSYPGDQTVYNDGMYFTEIGNWTKERDKCWPNPCTGRTKCVVVYTGEAVCITFDAPCDSHRCVNDGVCRNEVKGYRCLCPPGYYGTYCENTPCTGRICYNDGSCVISGSTWSCSCPSGYYGSQCQYTPCTGKTCYNSGTCVISGSSWSCDCKDGYDGSQCQNTPCTGQSCYNGGTCVISGSSWNCQCPSGYDGTRCQNTPCTGVSCAGTCTVKGSGYRCCWEGFWGKETCDCGASISFYYCIYGDKMGALKVYQDSSLLWQKSGNQGASWKYVVINLAVNKLATSQIAVEGSRDTGFRSDIAIDDFKLTIDTYCGASISFYYCIYGDKMGALKVYQDSNLLWQKSGNQGTSWKYVVINLAVNKLATSQIAIEGSRGTGFRSDIAIDDFKLTIDTSKTLRLDITGGKFAKNTYMNSYVIFGVDKVGPKMCVSDCMLYNGCTAVNFNMNELSCEFLSVSYPGDQTVYKDGMYFTEIGNWTKEQNKCWPNPCTGRTKCVVVYSGKPVCITFDAPCDTHGCVNEGVCRNEVKGYRCLCPAGYSGTYCENTPCTGRICSNDGSCVNTGSSWSCSCPSGYYGSQCQYTPCTGQSCYNGGTCVISGSSWNCQCPSGYDGTRCQNTPCSYASCDGTCSVIGSGYRCCWKNFWGQVTCVSGKR